MSDTWRCGSGHEHADEDARDSCDYDRASAPDEVLGAMELLEAVQMWDPISAIDREPTIEAATRLLLAVREARRALGLAEDEIQKFIVPLVPRGGTAIDGVGYVAVKSGSQRTQWDHDGLASQVVKAIADEMGVTVSAVEEVVRFWRDCASPSWKVTGLRPLLVPRGVDPDEYCHKEPGKKSVVVE